MRSGNPVGSSLTGGWSATSGVTVYEGAPGTGMVIGAPDGMYGDADGGIPGMNPDPGGIGAGMEMGMAPGGTGPV